MREILATQYFVYVKERSINRKQKARFPCNFMEKAYVVLSYLKQI